MTYDSPRYMVPFTRVRGTRVVFALAIVATFALAAPRVFALGEPSHVSNTPSTTSFTLVADHHPAPLYVDSAD